MRTLLATATAVLLLGSLSACSDDDPEPRFEATTQSPPSAPPPSSALPTSAPPAVQESAAAFLKSWQYEAYQMQVTGNSAVYRSQSRGCESCDAFADTVDEIYDVGGSISTRPTHVKDVMRVGVADEVLVFEYALVSDRSVVRNKDGQVTRRFPGGSARYQVNVLRKDDHWLVSRISQLTP